MCTNIIRHDGFGAQYQTIICSILLSELHGYKFYYTRPDLHTVYSSDEVEEFEKLMNIRGNYPDASGNEYVINPGRESYPFFENNIDACLKSESMNKIKSLFKSGKKTPFDEKYKNVAVHIRRPSPSSTIDIPEHLDGLQVKHITDFSVNHGERFTHDKHFLDAMDCIRDRYPNAKFHIFSEGDLSLFKAFEAPDVLFRLNENAAETFTMCVFADVLLTCKSSFSYTAAILSDNEIWYTKFWHPPASHWNIIKS